MMISRTWSRKSIAFCIAVAVLSVYSMVALATPGQKAASGELSVSGQVTVNGQAAISGATVFSDSVVATAANSTATISLGKIGRVQLFPNTSIRLSFSDGNISASLDAGRVQVSTLAGTAAIVTAKDGAAVADASQAATFMVDVECGNMIVASQAGLVELRAAGKTKAVAAGTSESAGTPQPGTRCTRLTRPDTFGSISGGALAALLLAAGGAIAAAIIAASHDNDLNFGGNVTVVSPTK
jgi:ferric-dicitrate binding protein FerR (iron transport regulator)